MSNQVRIGVSPKDLGIHQKHRESSGWVVGKSPCSRPNPWGVFLGLKQGGRFRRHQLSPLNWGRLEELQLEVQQRPPGRHRAHFTSPNPLGSAKVLAWASPVWIGMLVVLRVFDMDRTSQVRPNNGPRAA